MRNKKLFAILSCVFLLLTGGILTGCSDNQPDSPELTLFSFSDELKDLEDFCDDLTAGKYQELGMHWDSTAIFFNRRMALSSEADITYYGEINDDNRANGKGTFAWDGKLYIGELNDGKTDGFGAWYNDGTFYLGFMKEEELQGEGNVYSLSPNLFSQLDGNLYSPQQRMPDVLKHLDEYAVLESGNYVDGKLDGDGIRYYQGNNSTQGAIMYKGHFKKGEFSGEGTLYSANGFILYEGEFKKGEYEGNGSQYDWENGIIRTGTFENGVLIKPEKEKKLPADEMEEYSQFKLSTRTLEVAAFLDSYEYSERPTSRIAYEEGQSGVGTVFKTDTKEPELVIQVVYNYSLEDDQANVRNIHCSVNGLNLEFPFYGVCENSKDLNWATGEMEWRHLYDRYDSNGNWEVASQRECMLSYIHFPSLSNGENSFAIKVWDDVMTAETTVSIVYEEDGLDNEPADNEYIDDQSANDVENTDIRSPENNDSAANDVAPPELKVYNIGTVIKENISLMGSVHDANDSAPKVTINGESVSVDSTGSFEHFVKMSPGENIFTVTAENKDGKKTVQTVKGIYNPQ